MEERRKAKKVAMNVEKPANAERPEKLSYEQLENVAAQLSEQNRQLNERFQNVANVYNRLNFLFKVMEHFQRFNAGFVSRCSSEIENIITIPSEEKESPEEPKKEN